MYLIGAAHAHKVDAQRALERLLSDRERLVSDAEVTMAPRTWLHKNWRSRSPGTMGQAWAVAVR